MKDKTAQIYASHNNLTSSLDYGRSAAGGPPRATAETFATFIPCHTEEFQPGDISGGEHMTAAGDGTNVLRHGRGLLPRIVGNVRPP